MTKEKTKKAKTDEVPIPKPTSTVSEGQDWSPGDPSPTYVVVRHTYGIDHRVSDKEYSTPTDPRAVGELTFWQETLKRRPDGTTAAIVRYEKKKHRVW